MNFIALRGGFKSLTLSKGDNFKLANSEEGLTLGFGLNYDFAPNLGLFIDYAYQDFGKLTYAQQFSLGVKF
jgi:outer membrane autotransporter protein